MTNSNRKANSESDQDKDERKGGSESPPAEEAEAPSVAVAGDNWAVEYKEGVGNHVLATRDIEPNEVNNEQMRESDV